MEKKSKKITQNPFSELIVYQIYPRSFYDENGDGVGDLKGITAKIPHLKKLGVNAVWICPCYKSPNADNGYDVSDYREINPQFGTLIDWERMAAALHENGIKIIMDFVANHTSDEHFWFREARLAKDNPYRDYYIWRKQPPNAWQSVFGGSAWEYDKRTGEYYLHSFDKKQPDLNWQNPAVRKEMQAVVDFWAEKGVDGFRCDVLDFIAKDFEKGLMFGGEALPQYIAELFGRKSTAPLFTVGECQADEKNLCDICGEKVGKLKTVFQFEHMRICGEDKYLPRPFSFDSLKNALVKWQNFAAAHGLLLALFTDNHDYPYFISRYGNDKAYRYECATGYAAACFLLRGIPFLYQSQEYGAANPSYERVEDFDDVETVNRYRDLKDTLPKNKLFQQLNTGSRDNTRRPFAWTSDKRTNYGFSSGTPWLSLHSRAEEINLEMDERAEKSVFRFYQKLLALRKKSPAALHGDFSDLTENKNAFVYARTHGKETLIVVYNHDRAQPLRLPSALTAQKYALVLSNYAQREKSPFSPLFQSFETAVYSSR